MTKLKPSKQTDNQMTTSLDLITSLLDSIPDIMFFKNLEGIYVLCNSSFAEIVGRSKEKIIGNTDYDFFDKKIADFFMEQDRLMLKLQKPRHNEEWITYPDGRKILIDTLKTPYYGSDGSLIGILGVSRDITDRKRAEDSLRESEVNFRTFFDTVDDIILVSSPEGKIIYSNPATTKKLGYSPQEIKEVQIPELHPADKRAEAEVIFTAMLKGERDSCPLPVQNKNGDLVPVETRVWFGKWDGAACIFGICKDLTKEQEALQKFNQLFSSNPALMAVNTLPERVFTDVNDAFLNALGYTKEEVIGKTSTELNLFVQDDKQQEVANDLQAFGRIVSRGLKVRCKDGTVLDGLFSGEVISSQGKTYFLTVMVDQTERRKAEDALNKAKDDLVRMSKIKSEFTSMVSHELRTPLTSIKEAIGIVLDGIDGPVNDEQRETLGYARDSVDRLTKLINDVLDFSKMDSGKMRMSFDNVDICALAVKVHSLMKLAADKEGVNLSLYVPSHSIYVSCDVEKIEQVLVNLLDNAIKFTEKKGQIDLHVSASHDRVVLEVKDTGVGIEEKNLDKIFEAFGHVRHPEIRKSGGTGLGLCISKQIITAHGGEIFVKSILGKGTTFTVTIPYKSKELS